MEGGQGNLMHLCIEAACKSKESVRSWRKQLRTLESLPTHLAEPLLQQLLANRLLTAPLLEPFRYSVQELNLSGEPAVDAEWMAYIQDFRHLRVLNVADCKSLTTSAISSLSGMQSLEDLQMDRCKKITNEAMEHIVNLRQLKRLGLSETGFRQGSFSKLSALENLTHLNVGGLPVTDGDIGTLQVLQNLVHLNLWGSNVSNEGAVMLTAFPKLNELNLAWTNVTVVPSLPTLSYLDICSCTVKSIFEGCSSSRLAELLLSSSALENPARWLCARWLENLATLDLSLSVLDLYSFLPSLTMIVKLDLSFTAVTDSSVALLAESGSNLKWLSLAATKVSTKGVSALAGHLPVLEFISLRSTLVDDEVLAHLGIISSLSSINLARNHIKGTSISHLEQLPMLKKLDLRSTPISDKNCKRVARLVHLTHLLLCGEFLSNKTIHALSALPKLEFLAFQCTVLTDVGLLDFRPPPRLVKLDLAGCWLLSESGISQFTDAHPHVQLAHELHAGDGKSARTRKSTPSKRANATATLVVKDERIRYSRMALLRLQASASGNPETIPELALFPELLCSNAPQAA